MTSSLIRAILSVSFYRVQDHPNTLMVADTQPLSLEPDPIPPTAPAVTTTVSQTTTTTGTETWQWPHFDELVKAALAFIVVGSYVLSYLYGQYSGKHPDEGERATFSNYVMLALGFYLGAAIQAAKKQSTVL